MSARNNNGSNLEIPLIDLSREDLQTADLLVEALAKYGFAFVRGQGLGFDSEILNDMFDLVILP